MPFYFFVLSGSNTWLKHILALMPCEFLFAEFMTSEELLVYGSKTVCLVSLLRILDILLCKGIVDILNLHTRSLKVSIPRLLFTFILNMLIYLVLHDSNSWVHYFYFSDSPFTNLFYVVSWSAHSLLISGNSFLFWFVFVLCRLIFKSFGSFFMNILLHVLNYNCISEV